MRALHNRDRWRPCRGIRLARSASAIAMFALLAAAGGCGAHTNPTAVSTEASGPTFSLDKVRGCLLAKGARIGGRLNFVASTATGGAFVAHLGDNVVTIAFGQTLADGTNLEAAYQRFAFANVRRQLADVLRRYDNVVTLWHEHPQTNELALIVGCLE